MKKKYCSPSRENQNLTCYSLHGLQKIAEAYNQTFPNANKISIKGKSKTQLWNEIRGALSGVCNDETCWVEQNFVKATRNRELLNQTFRPKRPKSWEKNPTIWLDSYDIMRVMKQYEDLYPNFLFIGPIPRDCKIGGGIQCALTDFDIRKAYKSGIRKIGIVYNTDYSHQPGSHWNCIFVDIDNREIDFYDSYAEKPLPEVARLMRRIRDDLQPLLGDGEMRIAHNHRRHQYDEYNCGMYSMFFLVKRLEGHSMSEIEKMKITTRKMQNLKKLWYRNSE